MHAPAITMAQEDAKYIRDKVMAHNKWFEECIPMIASENLMSPLAKEMLISDFADRYAELAKKVFDAQFADVRPISGTVANMAVLFAFAQPGDTITTCALAQGAHISTCEFGAFGQRAVNSVNYPFNEHDMNLDVRRSPSSDCRSSCSPHRSRSSRTPSTRSAAWSGRTAPTSSD